MKLIEITDENNYEIVSKLREYKHQIIGLSPQEFDILLPLIKGYIFKYKQLKDSFTKLINEYQDCLKSEEFLEWKKNFDNFLSKRIKDDAQREATTEIMLYQTLEWGFINVTEHINAEREITNGISILFSIFEGFKEHLNFVVEKLYIASFHSEVFGLHKLFGYSIDFYFMLQDEIAIFAHKKTNYTKKAVFNVLSLLENVVMNNAKKAEQMQEKILIPKNQDNIPRRLRNEHLEFMKLRKILSENTYKNIAKQMNGSYSENSLKAMAKQINDTLGSNDIDQAIRNFENQYGAL